MGFVLVLVTTMYKGRCGSSVFVSHTVCIIVCFFISALQHTKLNLLEREQAAETVIKQKIIFWVDGSNYS